MPLSVVKGEENVSGMIFVMGIIVVALLTVGMGMSMLSGFNTPLEDTQNASKNVAYRLAKYSDRCWMRAGEGSSLDQLDCFRVRIDSTEGLEKKDITARLQKLPGDRLNLSSSILGKENIVAEVSYLPDEKVINITGIGS